MHHIKLHKYQSNSYEQIVSIFFLIASSNYFSLAPGFVLLTANLDKYGIVDNVECLWLKKATLNLRKRMSSTSRAI